MSLFNVLPGFQKSPAGLERTILRRLPRVLWLGTALLAACAALVRLLPWEGSAAEVYTRLATIDIWLISLAILHWTVVFTVAIGAFIVLVMKGPAYVADAYPLSHADRPASDPKADAER